MRHWTRVAALLVPLALLAACGGDDGDPEVTGPTDEDRSSDVRDEPSGEADLAAFCAGADAAMPILFMGGLAQGFGELGEGDDANTAAGAIQLMFSEQLLTFFREIPALVSDEARPAVEEMVQLLESGRERLSRAGLTDEQIEALASMDLMATDDPLAEVDEGAFDEARFEKEAAEFGEELAELQEGGGAVDDEFEELLDRCAAEATGGIEPCDLLTEADVSAVLGADVTSEGGSSPFGGGSGCEWEDTSDDDRALAVQIMGPEQFEVMVEGYSGTDLVEVPGLGDRAVLVPGYSSTSSFGTRGSSLMVSTEDRMIGVALKLGDEEVDAEVLTVLATSVLRTLG